MVSGKLRAWSGAASRAESNVQYYAKDFDWSQLRPRAEAVLEVQRSKAVASSTGTDAKMPDSDVSAQRWDAFHGRLHTSGRFFRPRRYLLAAFDDLRRESPPLQLLELGCGSGSAVVPLLQQNRTATVYAADFSSAALEAAGRNATEAGVGGDRFVPLLYDPTNENCDPFKNLGRKPALDGITMLFMLSAVRPPDMKRVLCSASRLLDDGKKVYFRDYGMYDLTQLRFPPESMLGDKMYQRQDGFVPEELEYCCVRQTNRKRQLVMDRVFVHGVFRKEVSC